MHPRRSFSSVVRPFLWLAFFTGQLTAADSTWSLETYGAKLDGTTDDRAALQSAIDAAHAAGGGTVVVPAGRVLLTGSFEIKSRVVLHLAPGSRILASTDPAAYEVPILIRATRAEDIAITGTRHDRRPRPRLHGRGSAGYFQGRPLSPAHHAA